MLKIGEFELLVLLSILRQSKQPYANKVREDLEENANRTVTRGALYRTLDRLEKKGLVSWELEASQIPERGGHPTRRLKITQTGLAAAQQQQSILLRFFDGLDSVAGSDR